MRFGSQHERERKDGGREGEGEGEKQIGRARKLEDWGETGQSRRCGQLTPNPEQVEGFVIDRNLSLGNLMGTIADFYRRLGERYLPHDQGCRTDRAKEAAKEAATSAVEAHLEFVPHATLT